MHNNQPGFVLTKREAGVVKQAVEYGKKWWQTVDQLIVMSQQIDAIFARKPKNVPIAGCTTKEQFYKRYCGVTVQRVNQLRAAANEPKPPKPAKTSANPSVPEDLAERVRGLEAEQKEQTSPSEQASDTQETHANGSEADHRQPPIPAEPLRAEPTCGDARVRDAITVAAERDYGLIVTRSSAYRGGERRAYLATLIAKLQAELDSMSEQTAAA